MKVKAGAKPDAGRASRREAGRLNRNLYIPPFLLEKN